MLPDMDSLALFVRAAELHSLTKAAEVSHIGLAAASRRISLLEHRFKAPLFERSPKGVELTPAGQALLAHAKTLLMHVNHMQADMGDHASGRQGSLRIFANTSAMTAYLPSDLAEFSAMHPGIRLTIREMWSQSIVNSVLAGDADIGIVLDGVATDSLSFYPYRIDRLAVVVPPSHPLAASESIRFTDVMDYDVAALEGDSSMMKLVASQAVVYEKTLRLRAQVRSFEAVCRMVQAGLGVGLLPRQAADALAPGMDLRVYSLEESWAERSMLVCVRPERITQQAIAALMEHLISVEQ
ncbi:LysR family transcriptional regulator [Acidovorax sp. JHL-9]|uniref:LysR family transcriptional regulator n=1 Tax=Acidovorax sp. JHL-9 TaxID=1276756 RepID=UPI0004792FFA|nr:LysR family transcriptional regulator [Acidovorax sp. JHL-9]